MATIEEMQNNMTIFYRKKTGDIKQIIGGIHDMTAFGNEQEDMVAIWDYVVLAVDQLVLTNTENFKINLETKSLEIKPEAVQQNSYPIASS